MIATSPHPEGERLHEDPADQIFVVIAAARDVDDAAEDIGEQQHEHQRLQRHVEQLLRDLADVGELPLGQDPGVGGQPARAGGPGGRLGQWGGDSNGVGVHAAASSRARGEVRES
ncbi:MAG TPA: hypothetical protein VGH14_05955 [Solirubrobacterales bacterium]|jgi:hypothetical protein